MPRGEGVAGTSLSIDGAGESEAAGEGEAAEENEAAEEGGGEGVAVSEGPPTPGMVPLLGTQEEGAQPIRAPPPGPPVENNDVGR